MVENSAVDAIQARLVIGLIVSAAVGAYGYHRGSLSGSGILGAIIAGTLMFGFGGLVAGLLLIAFFVSSSLLSHFKEREWRKQRAAEESDKGLRRDLGQALANGGVATTLAVASGVAFANRDYALASVLTAGMIGALAEANADTWATEIGVLSRSAPRLITHPTREVVAGTSGGITSLGTLAAIAGAAFIGLTYVVLSGASTMWASAATRTLPSNTSAERGLAAILGVPVLVHPPLVLVAIATASGFLGSLFDSLLGATVQARYYDDERGKETEKAAKRDGRHNRPIRGWRWLNNDWVNFISTLAGAGVAALMAAMSAI
jgi:uncharacterized protein (TIGR00297 family)